MSTKRITKEFAEISQNPPTASPPPSPQLLHPHLAHHPPPVLKFVTRLYHPNVTNDSLGNICLGLLKSENWKPSTKIASVLEAVRNLLVEPQPDDPLEDRIAEEYRNDRPAWEKKVKTYVEKYALNDPEFPAQAS
ncbi:E2 ubiquitin-conjugating enzyme 14 [Cladobotryum mycophilum]|uniref:E2 ubiquitin-conjugating enzyme 14 n=1 Tax=Cladobotryum mycophilum TaxID=491253 RepID=A0ABR0SX21_9HYPO